jgi:hypothetical protein
VGSAIALHAGRTVSLDEVDAGEEKVAESAVDDIDVEEDARDDGADHPFLEEEEEEEEEDDDDVSNLIDGDIARRRRRDRRERSSILI